MHVLGFFRLVRQEHVSRAGTAGDSMHCVQGCNLPVSNKCSSNNRHFVWPVHNRATEIKECKVHYIHAL